MQINLKNLLKKSPFTNTSVSKAPQSPRVLSSGTSSNNVNPFTASNAGVSPIASRSEKDTALLESKERVNIVLNQCALLHTEQSHLLDTDQSQESLTAVDQNAGQLFEKLSAKLEKASGHKKVASVEREMASSMASLLEKKSAQLENEITEMNKTLNDTLKKNLLPPEKLKNEIKVAGEKIGELMGK